MRVSAANACPWCKPVLRNAEYRSAGETTVPGSDAAVGTDGASDCPTWTFATAWRIQAPVAEREWISTRISSPSFSPRVSCVVSWVDSPSGSICSTSTPTVTDCAGKPSASQAAASAISPKPVPGMTGWPCTLWSSM